MDYTKLFILTFCAIGGYMAISYSGLARSSGWPSGHAFNKIYSFPMLLGFTCFLGSILVSSIVLPWWSLFIVLVAGLIGATLTTMLFKMYSQYLCILIMASTIILIPIYVL